MQPEISLESLRVLDAISRRGSFAAAAEALHRAPSSVTYAVQKLEEGLGVELFDRRGHRARLTPAGEALLADGRELLRLADGVARRVRRVACGWEAELRIAVEELVPQERILALCEAFYQVAPDTHLRLSTEILGGTWDALVSGRADLVIGAPGEGPPGGGYIAEPFGEVEFLFVVAPHHPLASAPEPLSAEAIRPHRAVAAADSSRGLPPRTVGLLPGQRVLTVPGLEAKLRAQRRGLGVGYLPRHLVAPDLASGRLLARSTEDDEGTRHQRLYFAWSARNRGKALGWFLERLRQAVEEEWFAPPSAEGGS